MCGLLVDPTDDSTPGHPENEDITRDETTKSLKSFPPEGYFCQPIVKELGTVVCETSAPTCLRLHIITHVTTVWSMKTTSYLL